MFWSKKKTFIKLNDSLKSGLNFGLTSGVITTLGLMIGLLESTGSKLAVLGGVLTIAIADAMSDAFGMHISEESTDGKHPRAVWQATIATFLSKFVFAITFIIPVVLFNLHTAVLISCLWGIFLLTILSLVIAKSNKMSPAKMVFEHLLTAAMVIIISYYAGVLINMFFSTN